ncbi:nucleotidyltransferase domain-containing protein [Ornithinibacillus scapharcae]|uniref:nucleotidyltransferase domain-containing protein n=1 Tax=Ornithinibacillus scapharcae TaxID=1147159 RepID=UPI000225B6AE|nr:nucleotidyltransferase domain-containing protein [Ornithinibacillus scapharcae]
MIDTIQMRLMQVEKEYNVKILYSCEVGSRAWGLSSPSSDYDVRFLYVHSVENYLSIDPFGTERKRDVIELPICDNLDINGWELTKALRLLRKSNPSLLEWLHTPICYTEELSTIRQIKDLLPSVLNTGTCIRHYVNMARGNLNRAVNKRLQIDLKHSINILRPILLAKWIQTYQKFPPFNMKQLVHTLITDKKMRKLADTIITLKINDSSNTMVDYPVLIAYCQSELNRLELYTKSIDINLNSLTADLDNIFRNTLNELSNSDLY